MSLITELSSDFSRAVRSRGVDYFQEGRIKITTGSDWEVYAKIRGSRIYRVDLAVEGSALIVHCDCQAFETAPCKHLWATILAVEGKGYLRGAGGPLELVPDFDEDVFYGGRDSNNDDLDDDDDGEYDKHPRDVTNFAGGGR